MTYILIIVSCAATAALMFGIIYIIKIVLKTFWNKF